MIRPGVVTYLLAVFATPALHGLAFPPARRYLWAWVALVPWFAAIRLAGCSAELEVGAIGFLCGRVAAECRRCCLPFLADSPADSGATSRVLKYAEMNPVSAAVPSCCSDE